MNLIILEIFHVNESEVGVFALLIFIASLVWMNFSAFSNVISPKISQYDNNRKALQQLYSKSMVLILLINCIVAVFIVIFSNEILLWFHKDMLGYKNWLFVVLVGACINCTLEIASPFLRFGGYQNQSAKIASSIITLNIILMPIAVLSYGMEGAIMVLVITRLLRGLSYVICLAKVGNIKPFVITT